LLGQNKHGFAKSPLLIQSGLWSAASVELRLRIVFKLDAVPPEDRTPDPQIRSGAPDSNRIIPLDFRQSEQQVTGWQSHSVRGFLAGIVRKRLKLDLESAVVEGIRVYRITAEQGATPAETRPDGRKT